VIEQWLGLSSACEAQKKGEKNKVDRRRKETESSKDYTSKV